MRPFLCLPLIEPVGQKLPFPPAVEDGGDLSVAHPLLAGEEALPDYLPRPGVHGQAVIAAQEHQQISGGVVAHSLEGFELPPQLVGLHVGVLPTLQVQLAGGDPSGQLQDVGAPIAQPHLLGQELLVHRGDLRRGGEDMGGRVEGEGLAQHLHQAGDHPFGLRPGGVGGEDGLDHVLEQGGGAQEAPLFLLDHLGQGGLGAAEGVKLAEVLVQAQHPGDLFPHLGQVGLGELHGTLHLNDHAPFSACHAQPHHRAALQLLDAGQRLVFVIPGERSQTAPAMGAGSGDEAEGFSGRDQDHFRSPYQAISCSHDHAASSKVASSDSRGLISGSVVAGSSA